MWYARSNSSLCFYFKVLCNCVILFLMVVCFPNGLPAYEPHSSDFFQNKKYDIMDHLTCQGREMSGQHMANLSFCPELKIPFKVLESSLPFKAQFPSPISQEGSHPASTQHAWVHNFITHNQNYQKIRNLAFSQFN